MAHACKSIPKNIFNFFFYFKCILLQISHKNVFFVNIFILGRSRVKINKNNDTKNKKNDKLPVYKIIADN